MSPTLKHFDNAAQLTAIATDIVCARLLEDINTSGQASLMVSGGSTPAPLYKSLSTQDISWGKVQVALVDERWVDENDNGSNTNFVRKSLLQNKAGQAEFIPMKTRHSEIEKAQPHVETAYQKIPRPYSAIVLGMGLDGHTASWFPGAEGLPQALDPKNKNLVQAITAKPSDVTGAYLQRMSLTRSAVENCTLALLLITGAQKKKVFMQALEDPKSPLPIRTAIDALGERLIVLSAD